MSRMEELLNAVVEGESTDIKPQSRMEAYLKACVDGSGTDGLPSPQSRSDTLLMKLANKIAGGGGGSGDLIDCDSLPTSNIEEGKIYRRRWTESYDRSESYVTYLYAPLMDVLARPIPGLEYVDTVDDVTSTDPNAPNVCKQDGKVYLLVDGVIVGYEELIGEECRQLGLVDESFVPDPDEPGMVLYTVHMQAGTIHTTYEKIALVLTDNTEILQYINNELHVVNHNAMKLLIEAGRPPQCFKNNQWLVSLDGVISYYDTSDVESTELMFDGCSQLTTVPLFDTSKVRSMKTMFGRCYQLTTVPLFNTSKVEDVEYMFKDCEELTTVPSLDFRSVVLTSNMFRNCYKLTECWLRNIRRTIQVGSGTEYGHLLTVDSLVHLIYELCDVGSPHTLTVGSVNLEKLKNVYVKTIPITDEMRAEDDLVDEKLPFVVCESTDEGAMLITDYVGLKNWSIK